MDFETILYEKRDEIAYVTLNRPKALNAITYKMMEEIDLALADVRSDEEIRALVFTGSGRAFSVGTDVGLLAEAFASTAQTRHFLETLNRLFLDIEALPLPVIAAVNGLARAGGFDLILSCDLAIAANEAQIGDAHTQFGVMPGGGATQRAPRRIGRQRALELIFTSRWLTGVEAAEYGIALRSVPGDRLSEAVEEIVAQLRGKSRDCLGYVKRAVIEGTGLPIEDAVKLETRYFLEYAEASPDLREGFAAYLNKREAASDRS